MAKVGSWDVKVIENVRERWDINDKIWLIFVCSTSTNSLITSLVVWLMLEFLLRTWRTCLAVWIKAQTRGKMNSLVPWFMSYDTHFSDDFFFKKLPENRFSLHYILIMFYTSLSLPSFSPPSIPFGSTHFLSHIRKQTGI